MKADLALVILFMILYFTAVWYFKNSLELILVLVVIIGAFYALMYMLVKNELDD